MKKILLILITILSSLTIYSQYTPSSHTTLSKPIGITVGSPTDARSYYYDAGTFSYRPYASTAEVLSYLNTTTKRTGNFPIYVDTGSGVIEAYWFKDGTTDGDLVPFIDSNTWANKTFTRSEIGDSLSQFAEVIIDSNGVSFGAIIGNKLYIRSDLGTGNVTWIEDSDTTGHFEIVANSITSNELASNAVDSGKIINNSVSNSDLAVAPAYTIRGNNQSSSGNIKNLTMSEFLALVQANDPKQLVQSLTDGATITWTRSSGLNASVTLGGNRTLSISGMIAGDYGTLRITQDGTGSRTLTLPANSKVINGGGGSISLSTTAGAVDIITVYYNGTNYYWSYGKNYN